MGAAAIEAALRGLTTPGRGIAGHQGLTGVMRPEFVKTMQDNFARQYKVETGLHPILDEYLSGSGSAKEVPGLDIDAARRLQPVLQDAIAETLKHQATLAGAPTPIQGSVPAGTQRSGAAAQPARSWRAAGAQPARSRRAAGAQPARRRHARGAQLSRTRRLDGAQTVRS